MKNKKYVIVSGNGPSLKEIDYSLLPFDDSSLLDNSIDSRLENFTILRSNLFYLEDKYYLGKTIDYAFTVPFQLVESYYAHNMLRERSEYRIGKTAVYTFGAGYFIDSHYDNLMGTFGNCVDCVAGRDYIAKMDDFLTFVKYNTIYHNQLITSGVYMLAFAVGLGYKEIYVAGIDLYQGNSVYAFEHRTPNVMSKSPLFKNPQCKKNNWNTTEIDIEVLNFLAHNYDVKFYSICPNSPINEYIPIAKSNKTRISTLEIPSKPKGYINDFLIPPKYTYDFLKLGKAGSPNADYFYPNPNYMDLEKIKNEAYINKQKLKNNVILRICKDIIRLPSDIWHYFKGRMLAKKAKMLESKSTL